MGMVMYAGVDYEQILRLAEEEADVVIWDGGNKRLPLLRADLLITVVDPLRPGHELLYHPGEANLRLADVVVINKVDSAEAHKRRAGAREHRVGEPDGEGDLRRVTAEARVGPDMAGLLALVVEDGPTLTHGGMPFGAGLVAARKAGVAKIIGPRRSRRLDQGDPGAVAAADERAAGDGVRRTAVARPRGDDQRNRLRCGRVPERRNPTPAGLITSQRPIRRVRYQLEEVGQPTLTDVLQPIVVAAARPVRP